MSHGHAVRIRIISIFIIIFAFGVLFRLYMLQVVHGDEYVMRADKQYINTNTTPYDRGDIYFESRLGELSPGAMTRTGYTLAIHPALIKDPQELYATLSSYAEIDKNDFLTKANKKDDPYEEIARRLNTETADKISKLKLPGVILSHEKWRFYPGDSLAAQTLGFVSFKGDSLSGNYGLERYYEDILKKDPSEVYTNFFAELFSNIQRTIEGNTQGDLVTTIEPSVQLFLENKLKEVREKWGSESAGGIIINPQNGEIYAIASNPTFNLNQFSEGSVALYKNPLVENVYEMGSIVKAITMASGLDSKAVTASTTYYDDGFLILNSKRISNYDGRGRGKVDMQAVLNQSLNTGAAYVALKMGNENFSTYMKNFGIGTETGIDLPNETRGLITNLDSTREIEMATASYGQGIAMTPVETVRALSVLANGGTLITPHIVKRINYDNGLFKKISFEPGKQVIKKETSEEITRMLVHVVDTALADGKAKIPEYSIAAKTGTAQMADEGRSGYTEGKYLHSFFGYFPAYNPKFLVFLFHTYPKGVRYASETLTVPFMDISKFLINYYELPPDR